jgi:hypothetical protein
MCVFVCLFVCLLLLLTSLVRSLQERGEFPKLLHERLIGGMELMTPAKGCNGDEKLLQQKIFNPCKLLSLQL